MDWGLAGASSWSERGHHHHVHYSHTAPQERPRQAPSVSRVPVPEQPAPLHRAGRAFHLPEPWGWARANGNVFLNKAGLNPFWDKTKGTATFGLQGKMALTEADLGRQLLAKAASAPRGRRRQGSLWPQWIWGAARPPGAAADPGWVGRAEGWLNLQTRSRGDVCAIHLPLLHTVVKEFDALQVRSGLWQGATQRHVSLREGVNLVPCSNLMWACLSCPHPSESNQPLVVTGRIEGGHRTPSTWGQPGLLHCGLFFLS